VSLPASSSLPWLTRQYFAQAYPESLISLSGSSSDEVLVAAGLKPGSQIGTSFSDAVSSLGSALTSPSSSGSTSDITTPCLLTTVSLHHDDNLASNVNAIDQLWPQLQELVEPYGLRRRSKVLDAAETGKVRQEADDLREPEKEVQQGAKS
jgi:hypothetical protein